MALTYKNDQELQKINSSLASGFTRLSEARRQLQREQGIPDARGGVYDQLQGIRMTITEGGGTLPNGSDSKLSDAWVHFENFTEASDPSNRFDQSRRLFHIQGSYF